MKLIKTLAARMKAFNTDAIGSSVKTQEASAARRLNATHAEVSAAANEQVDKLLARLRTSKEGLTEEEAEATLEEYGFNEVAHEKPPRWYIQLPPAFKNTFIILLIALALLSYLTGDLLRFWPGAWVACSLA